MEAELGRQIACRYCLGHMNLLRNGDAFARRQVALMRGTNMPGWLGGAALDGGLRLPREDQWKAQRDRVGRWYSRVARIRVKAQTIGLDAFDIDDLITYFQNCYYLRDWLSVSRPDLKNPVDKLFENHFELRACRDVCNGFKHKSLKRPSVDSDFNLYRVYDHRVPESGAAAAAIGYRLAFSDGDDVREYDIFEFADVCHKLWNDFIDLPKHKLIVESTRIVEAQRLL
ncbi:MAG: hypothetical protein K1X74_23190 [Pirellulales bacterium]|nr:hypothetical protein [Pirellulales bacterium]